MNTQRSRVINLYKTLHYLGNNWPSGAEKFHSRLKAVFLKNKDEKDPNKIETMIKHGEYVIKEIEALYMLKKYRTLKRMYYNE
ncbi:electron transfer flavoprotein regulatory factor 1 [Ctenocephalides felis]|uniref:electron transfer flavoprotein regulatory factor 1 n=1 Tax=Ctenocephalides felis TaxID=7515 RepID=UPI000E6E28B7|nr:electron transfer flavoprotein regulatory factor 1 [Ctenocephalides felis]